MSIRWSGRAVRAAALVLEVRAGGRIFKITAASLDDARAVAEKAIAKLK